MGLASTLLAVGDRLLAAVRGRADDGNGVTDADRNDAPDGDRTVVDERVHADREADFVVFHIGMRINEVRKVHRWLPVFLVAPRMVRELRADPASGLLGSRTVVGPGLRNVGFVQYWDSFESLREYARDGDRRHLPAWRDYYRSGARDDPAVGIWHETYLVDAEDYETVYNNVPPLGLGKATGTDLVPATDSRESAAGRLGRTDGSDSPFSPSGGE